MPRRVLDTNILIGYWAKALGGKRAAEFAPAQAARWGRQLADSTGGTDILTPIYIEFVCGQRTSHEMRLARAYLAIFQVADEGQILGRDWQEAKRIAERVPRDGLRRQLGDCLIRAICNRLNLEVLTGEKRFPT
jgi:predicted nucleic acid-binding protein